MTYHSACRDAVWRGVWNKKEMKLEPTTVWLKQKNPLSDELAINILSINLPPGPCAPFSTLSASLSEGLCTALMFWEPQKQLGNILFLFPARLKVSTKKTYPVVSHSAFNSGILLCSGLSWLMIPLCFIPWLSVSVVPSSLWLILLFWCISQTRWWPLGLNQV